MSEETQYEEKGWADAVLFVWLNVFGIGGAVGLSSILHEVIFWKGIFAVFIEWWDRVVRPLVHDLFFWAFDFLQLELTDFWKDWLAVGAIIGLGFLRQFVLLAYKRGRNKPRDLGEGWTYGQGPLIPPFLPWWTRISPLLYFVISPLLWPLTVLLFILDTVRAVWPPYDFATKRFIAYSISTVILPFYWLILFVAVNEYV